MITVVLALLQLPQLQHNFTSPECVRPWARPQGCSNEGRELIPYQSFTPPRLKKLVYSHCCYVLVCKSDRILDCFVNNVACFLALGSRSSRAPPQVCHRDATKFSSRAQNADFKPETTQALLACNVLSSLYVHVYLRMYVRTYVCMYVCMYGQCPGNQLRANRQGFVHDQSVKILLLRGKQFLIITSPHALGSLLDKKSATF